MTAEVDSTRRRKFSSLSRNRCSERFGCDRRADLEIGQLASVQLGSNLRVPWRVVADDVDRALRHADHSLEVRCEGAQRHRIVTEQADLERGVSATGERVGDTSPQLNSREIATPGPHFVEDLEDVAIPLRLVLQVDEDAGVPKAGIQAQHTADSDRGEGGVDFRQLHDP